jgi:hypothetical protein
MAHQRRVCEALACVLTVAACSGSAAPGPVRVYPRDGGTGHGQISVVSASLTEDALHPSREQLRLELAVANLGSVPVTDVLTQEGRLEGTNLDLTIAFSLDPASDASPIAPGETRDLVFEASVVPLGVCTADLEFSPNPHTGLVSAGVTVVSSAGGSALSGIDVAVTCQFPAGDVTFSCPSSVADACAATDMLGNPILHCAVDWGTATRDTSLCGTGAVDYQDAVCPGFTYRVLVIGGVERIYAYRGLGQSAAPLVAVLAPGAAGPVCLAGPMGGLALPGCDAVLRANAGPFQGQSAACPSADAGLSQPDGGPPSDGASPSDGAAPTDGGAPIDAAEDAATMPPDA